LTPRFWIVWVQKNKEGILFVALALMTYSDAVTPKNG
jgi:hypothetical protein